MTSHEPINHDLIARQIHEFYRRLSAKEKWYTVFSQPYEKLPEFMKEDNRAAARRMGEVLRIVGLQIAPRKGDSWNSADKLRIRKIVEEKANLEALAEAEHDGWMTTRRRNGWCETNIKPSDLQKRINAEERIQHLLIPFDKLDDDQKRKDRDSVRHYVEIVAKTRYCIVPVGDQAASSAKSAKRPTRKKRSTSRSSRRK
jgi:hypothetical protein